MSDKPRPPFDALKAAFYLVAGVIAVQCFVVLLGVAACIYYAPEIMGGKAQCNAKEQLVELLAHPPRDGRHVRGQGGDDRRSPTAASR